MYKLYNVQDLSRYVAKREPKKVANASIIQLFPYYLHLVN